MPGRRLTRVGKGAFGVDSDHDDHVREVLRRILSKRLPLTEDAVFLGLWHQLSQRRGSTVLQKGDGLQQTDRCTFSWAVRS